jgi:heme/copper-type cytochrome/quinol oxidase subunit 2
MDPIDKNCINCNNYQRKNKEVAVARFWKFVAIYLFIGILWSSFIVQRGAELGHFSKFPSAATVTVLANAFGWPYTLPLVIYRFIDEDESQLKK